MKKNNLKIVFLGTPEFAVPTLEKLITSGLAPFLVITQPDKPSGRKKTLTPPPVKIFAQQNGLTVKQPANKKELKEIFNELEVDLCVLVAFGMIIPKSVLEKPAKGFLNLHPSVLPKYRGPSPVQAAILAGDKKTAVTIMELNEKMDAGPILEQKEVVIKPNENYLQLKSRLAVIGAELMVATIEDLLAGKIKPKVQDDSLATYCSMVKREDGQINWSKSASEINQQFLAYFPWPGVFTYIAGKRLKIAKLSVLEGNLGVQQAVGQLFLGPNNELLIKTGSGIIWLQELQLEGKSVVSAEEFLKRQNIVGQILG